MQQQYYYYYERCFPFRWGCRSQFESFELPLRQLCRQNYGYPIYTKASKLPMWELRVLKVREWCLYLQGQQRCQCLRLLTSVLASLLPQTSFRAYKRVSIFQSPDPLIIRLKIMKVVKRLQI